MSEEHTTWLKEILSAIDDEDQERLAWAIQMARNSLAPEKATD